MFLARFFSPSSRCKLSEHQDEYWSHFAECCMMNWPGNEALERLGCWILKPLNRTGYISICWGAVGINHPSGCFIPASAELISSWGGTTTSKSNCYIRQVVTESPYTAYCTTSIWSKRWSVHLNKELHLVFPWFWNKKSDKSHPDDLVFGCSVM